ncbi:MFS transporter [Streptomyces sp. NPDC059740]|uniref:MFS transporter n=1 Tax=Streptomyces sp. NPDC059740 TaxID=3346926 RepID=UPI0036563262
MSSPYRAIFRRPGTLPFSAAGLLGRMPQSMMGVGVVTMVSALTGRYGLAGALTATLALSSAALGPQVSRWVDRYGQRRVLRPAAVVSLAAVAVLLLSAERRWPDWTLFACAVPAGCVPSTGAMVRARWALIHGGSPRLLHAAYAWESVVDELCFIIGPILSIGLSTAWFPEAGPLLAAVFLAVGIWWLTAQRATEPPPHPHDAHSGGSALRSPGLRVLVATFVATGVIFGAVDVVTVAFAAATGHRSAASVVLATYALGSCSAGAVFGLLHPRGPVARRWVVGVAAMAVSMIPLQLAGNLPVLAAALFVAGLSVAPTMVTTVALVERHVPGARLTEGMTWTSTGLCVGVALGSSVAGSVVDAAGARAGYAVPAVAGALGLALALLGYRRLRTAPQRPGGAAPQARGGAVDDRGVEGARDVTVTGAVADGPVGASGAAREGTGAPGGGGLV